MSTFHIVLKMNIFSYSEVGIEPEMYVVERLGRGLNSLCMIMQQTDVSRGLESSKKSNKLNLNEEEQRDFWTNKSGINPCHQKNVMQKNCHRNNIICISRVFLM